MLKLKLLTLALIAATTNAFAADFPLKDKPITIVVPFTAGGPTDRVARDLAEAIRQPLGAMAVVIENAAGAGSSIGSNKVAKANKRRPTHQPRQSHGQLRHKQQSENMYRLLPQRMHQHAAA